MEVRMWVVVLFFYFVGIPITCGSCDGGLKGVWILKGGCILCSIGWGKGMVGGVSLVRGMMISWYVGIGWWLWL